jgi:cellulose synthase/poly-beta-1,6-N-acetylglucosamine synthase-like glycosyltransferase
MTALCIICLLLTVAYVCLMAAYRRGWGMQKEFVLPEGFVPATFISIIIPARNERNNIAACIDAILAQRYPVPLFEIIVVDDHSEDGTAEMADQYAGAQVRCIRLADHLDVNSGMVAYKKAAIAAGIAQSKGEFIITTDADCTAPDQWLLYMAAIYEREEATMVIAPVIFSSDRRIVQLFQLIDFMSMQGITIAAHNLKLGNMSNGANLAFSKAAYKQIGGYAGIDHMASGDDYLLMMKMNNNSANRISCLKSVNAIVTTTPQPDWRGFIQQRIRWASKSGKYNDPPLTAILILVYLFNCSLAALVIGGLFQPLLLGIAGLMLAAKIVSEYIFLLPVARFFKREWVLKYFIILQPLHIAYIVIAGFLGFFGGYKWKGRQVR